MFDSSYLAQHGVTNLIEVDGLLYAPVSDLWSFFQRYNFDGLIELILVVLCLSFFAFGLGRLVGYLISRCSN